jgi:hypothetical protein
LPGKLADGLGWSERFFIDEIHSGHVDEHSYIGRGLHSTKGAAITACFALARQQLTLGSLAVKSSGEVPEMQARKSAERASM